MVKRVGDVIMNEDLSSSVNEFTDASDEAVINETAINETAINEAVMNEAALNSDVEVSKSNSSIDSRRRLEALLAERQLEKDIQEFNFDF